MLSKKFYTTSSISFIMLYLLLVSGCSSDSSSETTLEQADILYNSGRYSQALSLYEELVGNSENYDSALQYRLSEVAVLASQAERNRSFRQKARVALEVLSASPGDSDSLAIGHLWRRLGWEMVRDNDSLQAYEAFGSAIAISPELNQVFEEEWLLRGRYASMHLASIANITDSIIGTQMEDSILRNAAESHIVELARVPLVRTDIRGDVLFAMNRLFQYTPDRNEDALDVLTELDRMGLLTSSDRQKRMEILLLLAEKDLTQNDILRARERFLEVWGSNFTGVRVEAAFQLGLMAENSGNSVDALMWYSRACQVAPGLNSGVAIEASARRDSLRYLVTP